MITIAPIPLLLTLREQVLNRSLARVPKWGFRLTSNLALQLQPAPTAVRLFHGRAVLALGADVPASVFALTSAQRRAALPNGWIEVRLSIECAGPGASWRLQPLGWRWSRTLGTQHTVSARAFDELRAAFTDGRLHRLAPEIMLSPHCLVCGRGLTDPASMARWIGPECAGSGSLTVPGLLVPREAGA